MSTNMNDVKKHPGLIAFRASNVKVGDSNTQAKKESEVDSKDRQKDSQKA